MQCHMRLQVSHVKYIGDVLEQNGVAFRLASPYGGLLVVIVRHVLSDHSYTCCNYPQNFVDTILYSTSGTLILN